MLIFKTLKTLKNLIIIKKIEIQLAFHCWLKKKKLSTVYTYYQQFKRSNTPFIANRATEPKCQNAEGRYSGRVPTLPKDDVSLLTVNTPTPQTWSWWRKRETNEKGVALRVARRLLLHYQKKVSVTQPGPALCDPMDNLLQETVPARLLCPQDSPGKHTGVDCHFLFQGIFPTQRLNRHIKGHEDSSKSALR